MVLVIKLFLGNNFKKKLKGRSLMNDQPPQEAFAGAAASAQTGAGVDAPFGAAMADGGGGNRAGKTQACEKFRRELFGKNLGGWNDLKRLGLAEIFQDMTNQRGQDHSWEYTADGFFNYCVTRSWSDNAAVGDLAGQDFGNLGEDALVDLMATL